jgi:hypothetical protein
MTGIQAGLINSKTDVHWEPLNLAQCYPTSRPGDLQLDVAPAPSYITPPLLPFAKAAIDVNVINSFSSQSVGDSSYTASITKHLQIAEKEKLCGPPVNTAHTFVNREMIIQALNNSNTILIPFIVKPFGGLGPLQTAFSSAFDPTWHLTHYTSKAQLLNK